MGNNTFSITISAVDKATATVRKVNDSIDRLTRPFAQVGKSFKGLGRELGFDKIGKNLGYIGREAATAARGVTSMVAPLAAITGVGSVAGIAALANNWAKLGRSIDNSARNIGISSGQLQSFQGAAKLVGIDSETTTGSLDALATTMQDARWGRNQGALMLLNKLGIGLKRTKDGANDVVGEYKAIADAIAKETNPQVQALIANNLGLGGMLPFLRQGSAGIEQFEQMTSRLGYVMGNDSVQRAKAFAQSLAGLEVAVDGTKNAIGDALIPVMKPLVDQFANWLAVNRELIATNVAGWAKSFAAWLSSINWKAIGDGLTDFLKGIEKTVEWLGGWENAAIAVAVVMNASVLVSVISLTAQLARAGIGVLAFVGQLWKWQKAATAASAAQEALAVGRGTGLLAGAGLALSTAAVGAGAMLYSGTLNDGEDAEVSRRKAMADAANGEVRGGNEMAGRVAKYFQNFGWTKEQAAGIAANLSTESGFDPQAVGDGGDAYGVAQWHPDRQAEFRKWAGKSIQNSTLEDQLGFVNYELTQGNERAAGDALRATKTAGEAGAVVSRRYERPKYIEEEASNRGRLAESMMSRSNERPKSIEGEVPKQGRQAESIAAPQGPISSGAVQVQESKVHVEVELKNAPEGTKAQVKTQGNAQATSRIAYSGVGAIA
ncbi:hypothetical protein HNP46_002201 [Pseudomonas nitritireducens]|uniref:Phage tail lysozyme domain-containing protein n=1 Tax=Pseudomonas nitroreducens TaxID=46680 RepID=A0A7W7KIG7_PSENT|nr:phage tail tip lysozyme [Pseudomonas nitritireducens]MBB4863354.1 hypothetical protein [Pseudomonas nitritireducens]